MIPEEQFMMILQRFFAGEITEPEVRKHISPLCPEGLDLVRSWGNSEFLSAEAELRYKKFKDHYRGCVSCGTHIRREALLTEYRQKKLDWKML